MTDFIGVNIKVEVQATLASPITVTGVSLANPALVTAINTLVAGDVVVFSVPNGMVELDQQVVRVASPTGTTFLAEGLDTTVGYDVFTAGTALHVATFQTLAMAQNLTMPNPAPVKIDLTRLIDKKKRYTYGLPDAPDGSIKGLRDVSSAAIALIKAATKANATVVFRMTWPGPLYTIWNAQVSGGQGFDLAVNAAATQDIAFTPVSDVMDYAT